MYGLYSDLIQHKQQELQREAEQERLLLEVQRQYPQPSPLRSWLTRIISVGRQRHQQSNALGHRPVSHSTYTG